MQHFKQTFKQDERRHPAIQCPASEDSSPKNVSAWATIENVAITHDKRQLIGELFSRLQLLSHAEW